MVAQDILVVLVLVRTQVSQPKTAPENHFRGCLYFTIIRTLSVYLCSTYIRCGHIYTPSRHEIKRHTTLRQTHLILPLFFSAANDFSISGEWFSNLYRPFSSPARAELQPSCTPNSCVLGIFPLSLLSRKREPPKRWRNNSMPSSCYGSACWCRPFRSIPITIMPIPSVWDRRWNPPVRSRVHMPVRRNVSRISSWRYLRPALVFPIKKPYPARLSYFGRHATFQLSILYKYRAGLTTLTGLICIFPDPSAEKAWGLLPAPERKPDNCLFYSFQILISLWRKYISWWVL